MFFHIENAMENLTEDPKIKVALTAAHEVLAKYYTKMDDSFCHVICVLLDPKLKKQFFHDNEFDTLYPNYVNSAIQEVREMLDAES